MSWALLVMTATGLGAAPPAVRYDADGDPLPRGAIGRIGSTRWRLAWAFRGQPTFSPDGRYLVATNTLWDARTGTFLTCLPMRADSDGTYPRPAFTPDGKRLLMPSWENGEALALLVTVPEAQPVHRWAVECLCVAVSPDGKVGAAAGYSGEVHLLDLRT